MYNYKKNNFINYNLKISDTFFLIMFSTIPGIIAQWYYFGYGSILQILIGIIISTIFEIIIITIKRKKQLDNYYSSLVTVFILGLSIPPLSPWWIMTIGILISVIIGKHIYGGFGKNFCNPAMIGYAILLFNFPIHMTNWISSDSVLSNLNFINTLKLIFFPNDFYKNELNNIFLTEIDSFTEATPLEIDKFNNNINKNIIYNLLYYSISKNFFNIITINISFFIGGIFLLIIKKIKWYIPIGIFITLIFFYFMSWKFFPNKFLNPIMYIFSYSSILCAFFIATDPITTCLSNKSCFIFGLFIGTLIWIIRNFSNYPDGIAFIIILMNLIVPLIDYYILYEKNK